MATDVTMPTLTTSEHLAADLVLYSELVKAYRAMADCGNPGADTDPVWRAWSLALAMYAAFSGRGEGSIVTGLYYELEAADLLLSCPAPVRGRQKTTRPPQ
jgi:hypothetical protein